VGSRIADKHLAPRRELEQ
jgi:hypothetical protein